MHAGSLDGKRMYGEKTVGVFFMHFLRSLRGYGAPCVRSHRDEEGQWQRDVRFGA